MQHHFNFNHPDLTPKDFERFRERAVQLFLIVCVVMFIVIGWQAFVVWLGLAYAMMIYRRLMRFDSVAESRASKSSNVSGSARRSRRHRRHRGRRPRSR